jgi:Ser/Thr protein kinase RdoA (MazF antagonist)
VRFEPAFDRDLLRAAAERAYGLTAAAFNFVPLGLGSACYTLRAGDGSDYLLKLWTHLRLGEPAAERQYLTLVLTRALHDRRVGLRVPYPVLTRDGALWADLGGTPFALAPLLPGRNLPGVWPLPLRAALGRDIATLHRATPLVADLALPEERFALWFEPQLRRDLVAAAATPPDARPGLLALRAWVLAHGDDVAAQLARLHVLGAVARRQERPLVLAHTDLHHYNVLVDDAGGLAILDWDDVKLAPPEFDLWLAFEDEDGGAGMAALLAGYREGGGVWPLSLDQYAYYLLRRHVEDMAVDTAFLLAPNAETREDDALLASLDHCAERWSRLDATLTTIAHALRESGG